MAHIKEMAMCEQCHTKFCIVCNDKCPQCNCHHVLSQYEEKQYKKKSYPNKGRALCLICGEDIGHNNYASHLKASHPEYSFTIGQVDYSRTYQCDKCHMKIPGVTAMINHYQNKHIESVNLMNKMLQKPSHE